MPEERNGRMEDRPPRATDRYIALSGADQYGKPKAHIILTYSERFSDGSSRQISEVTIPQKAFVNIFQHAGYVNVDIDFRKRTDTDLALMWQLLFDYSRPVNSVAWLPEEIESGVYIDENGVEKKIWFPYVELAVSPAGHETDFMVISQNPIFYTLQPSSPQNEPAVIQLTFNEDFFHVVENLRDSVDLDAIREEVVEQIAAEMAWNGQHRNRI